jgi:DnaJ-class molecular chaperone
MKTKRKSIWDNDYAPYGTYTGANGNSRMWKDAFAYVMNDTQAAEIIKDDSPWGILGIAIGATIDEIKKAFHKLALQYHPDKGGNADMFMKVQAAYYTLLKG